LRHRIGIFFLIILFLATGTAVAATPDQACEELSLEQAASVAMKKNPGLAAIRARYEAIAAIPTQQSSLPDPVLVPGAVNMPVDTFNLDQENMTQMQIGLSRKFPFPGKLA